MRKFLSAPLSNAVAVLLAIAFIFAGSGAAPELAPLALGGAGTTNFTNLALTGTLDVDGAVTMEAADFNGAFTTDSTIASTNTNAASASANPIDVTSVLGIMNGSDDYTALDINLTNANHTGSNTVQGVDIANITGDNEATEIALKVGTGWDTGLSIAAGGATIVGTVALDASEIGATEIADVTRRISFPLFSFVECTTNAATALLFTDGTDALPHFANSSTDGLGGVIRYDDTGSSEDETTKICNSFMVPPDYASGGTFTVRALKDGHTATESEDLNCAVSVNGAALQTVGTVAVAAAATAAYTCTPTIAALVAGDSVSFYLTVTSETGGAEPIDDTVDIAAVGFTYTATQ